MSSPEPPELSVVVPAFDAVETIGDQLAALVAQSVPFPWEIVVADNGSRDGTRELVSDLRAKHPEIRLVDASARRGPSAARNAGARAARATLLAFCDADDVVGEGWVVAMREALRHSALVTGRWEGDLLNPGGGFHVTWTTDPLVVKPYLPWLVGTGAGNLGIRRSVFESLDGFEESLATCEDVDLCWRAQLAGHRLTLEPTAVLHVRKRDGLRATFRQAYAYALGDEQLRHRFAQVIARGGPGGERRDRPVSPHPARRRSVRGALLGTWSTIVGKARRGRGGVADTVWRLGEWWGHRRGRAAPAVPVVVVRDECGPRDVHRD
ncbi:glycosyltransferase [Cellulosimicrobium sp. NPDC055967]|uniref:glycosyltransferase n=1 Tax=Cellulosimicrobium sp. NPDC055967 TaxID=3345670 RepID=UPI0035D9EEA6